MKKVDINKMPAGPELDALVAEAVMGWQKVHRHGGNDGGNRYSGRKQDKLGRWRLAEVPPYSTDPRESSAVEARIKEFGLLNKYLNELSKIAHTKICLLNGRVQINAVVPPLGPSGHHCD